MIRARALVAFAALAAGCAPRESVVPAGPSAEAPGAAEVGLATWYGGGAGRPTASGEPFDPRALTAAHRTLPFGTVALVIRRDNGRRVIVRINDRGPYGKRQRVIDLSRAAAERLDMIRDGVVPVEVRIMGR